jgi:hypothetical protein
VGNAVVTFPCALLSDTDEPLMNARGTGTLAINPRDFGVAFARDIRDVRRDAEAGSR